MASTGKVHLSSFMIQKDVNLKPYNTLGIDSTAHSFVELRDKEQLTGLANDGFFDNIVPFILGGGSNILLTESLSKPVIKISIPGIDEVKREGEFVWIKSGAGVVWHDLVTWAVEKGYGGIENLALIPGTVGAAPIQNIGAYGVELEEVFESLDFFDMNSLNYRKAGPDLCNFGYRDSIFKRELKGKAIVISVTLKLKLTNHRIVTEYYALRQWFEDKGVQSPGIRDVYDAVISIRQSKLPDPKLIGNAGSFFKNPIVEKRIFESLKNDFPDVPVFPVDDESVKIPAGWLIEKAGWKGKRVGNVGTYKNQALVIVNHGQATGREIQLHAMNIRESVKEMFGIELTPEVDIIE
jgi:UDP-N-acetylmuramate dehydrogenase